MGRRKIPIQQITDPKLRLITFHKRKKGLIKKAAEMSLLCNVNLVLIFEDGFENLIQFSKNKFTSMDAFLKECRYNNVLKLTADEYPSFEKMTRYRNTVGVEGQEKISYEDEMIEKEHSHDSDSDEEFLYFHKQDMPREDSNQKYSKQSKTKKTQQHGPSPEELYEDDQTLVKNETIEDPNLKDEYNESPPSSNHTGNGDSNNQNMEITKMMVNNQIGETMRVAGQRGMEYIRQLNQGYGEQFLYPRMGNLMTPMNQMFPYNDVAKNQIQNLMGSGNDSAAVKNQKMINFLMTKDRPIFSQDMYNDQFLNPTKIFPPKESVTDLNNPPVHNRDLGYRNQNPNFINQNSLYYDQQVLNSSCINSDKFHNPNQQRILQSMMCKQQHQEMPIYDRNFIQGEENIKLEEKSDSAMRTTLEKIKKKIKSD